MDDPGDDADDRTGGNLAPANLVSLKRLAPGEGVDGREEPQRLVEDHARIGQAANIVVRGRFAFERFVDFRPKPLLHSGVLRKQEPGPAKRQRRGLMPGDEDGDHLVTHVLGRQSASGLGIAGVEEPVQQVDV